MKDNPENKQPKWAQNLPQYTPPASSWEAIESELRRTKSVRFEPRAWWLAAASVALVVGVFGWLATQQTNTEKITYSEEKLTKPLAINASQSLESQSAQIEAYCIKRADVCQKPAFKNLKQQLDQLNAAHQELKTVIETYNPDPNLVAQFVQIDSDRTDVLRKIFEEI